MCQHRHSPLICVCGRGCLWFILVGSGWGWACPFTGRAQGVGKVRAGDVEATDETSTEGRQWDTALGIRQACSHEQISPRKDPGSSRQI